jgi:hypothetical protein
MTFKPTPKQEAALYQFMKDCKETGLEIGGIVGRKRAQDLKVLEIRNPVNCIVKSKPETKGIGILAYATDELLNTYALCADGFRRQFI